ncbi:MAG: glucosyl-3-phosphoglycerate synthase [Actinomycetota bacterium]|nr:glucosyl-3-phosphoglycerate synthase [Actinomycetota bacterium]
MSDWSHPHPHLHVDEWFETHTFGPSPLSLEELIALKEQRGLTISVCLPALDEAETVGAICRLLRESLMEAAPFVDEVVVVDSGSTDATVDRARDGGAAVYRATDLVPSAGPRVLGKGDALWRSLSVVTGDLIVWLDSDTRNPHPGFVTDLITPLLRDESLVLTKAFYDRPLAETNGFLTTGGARVTEIAARPLLHLFYPELTGVIQPLSGEYAGYRVVLEELPFFTGYGVDIGLLIDFAERFGVDRIGQVDLGRRVHRNRPTLDLGRMAFQVMLAMFTRLDELGRLKLTDETPTRLTQFAPSDAGPARTEYELSVVQRPPMKTVAGRGS